MCLVFVGECVVGGGGFLDGVEGVRGRGYLVPKVLYPDKLHQNYILY